MNRRGSAAIEFVLCLPLLVLVVGGIVDLGRATTVHHSLHRVARDAARVGGRLTSDGGGGPAQSTHIQAAARSYGQAAMAAALPSCGPSCPVFARWFVDEDDTTWLTVTVEAPFDQVFGFLPDLGTTLEAEFTVMTDLQPEL